MKPRQKTGRHTLTQLIARIPNGMSMPTRTVVEIIRDKYNMDVNISTIDATRSRIRARQPTTAKSIRLDSREAMIRRGIALNPGKSLKELTKMFASQSVPIPKSAIENMRFRMKAEGITIEPVSRKSAKRLIIEKEILRHPELPPKKLLRY